MEGQWVCLVLEWRVYFGLVQINLDRVGDDLRRRLSADGETSALPVGVPPEEPPPSRLEG
jgi:hypothetical protein